MHEKRASHQLFYINREHRLTVSVMKTTLFVFGKSERQSPHAMIEIPRTDLGTTAMIQKEKSRTDSFFRLWKK